MKNLVIIGGSDAGISAALRAREIDPDIRITMIVADSFPNFSICGLPYYISHDVIDWKNLAHRTKEEIENKGITLLLDHRVEAIDTQSKKLNIVFKDGSRKSLLYDKLIIGTGAVSVRPEIPGIDNH